MSFRTGLRLQVLSVILKAPLKPSGRKKKKKLYKKKYCVEISLVPSQHFSLAYQILQHIFQCITCTEVRSLLLKREICLLSEESIFSACFVWAQFHMKHLEYKISSLLHKI